MGEIKSVKVDNWGVFFLQKLQNFFNKTDYCDLTLQFRDNSQLKVHRLVLSACTDYFNVLEHTCEMIDDALIMPNELQADVVVPIVNFMYTGTLEFELKMYGKLLRTAKEMNMTVLLKLLEAHRRTMEGVNRAQRPPSPKPIRRRTVQNTATVSPMQRRIITSSGVSTPTGAAPRQQTKNVATNAPAQLQFRQQIGSTSLTRTTVSPQKSSRDDSSSSPSRQQQQATSPFEQLRKGYNNTKRPAATHVSLPPAKRPNIEDVKEFAEQQRMRKQIAAEFGDDPDYEGVLDDDIHNDDDDEDMGATTAKGQEASPKASASHDAASFTFRREANEKSSATIVVKDGSNSKLDHAKIITEVLRQYPHLVKSNKNIKLKIMPNSGGQPQKIIVTRKDHGADASGEATGTQHRPQVTIVKQSKQDAHPTATSTAAGNAAGTTAGGQAARAQAGVDAAAGGQKRRIDSKTMHALIALGAENTTGPWLCLRCGVNGRPISIPSYRGFRRHLINTHKELIDAALCEHCGYRSADERDLHFHLSVEHKVKSTAYEFPECRHCAGTSFVDAAALRAHVHEQHPEAAEQHGTDEGEEEEEEATEEANKQQCIYCNKIFAKELQLYTHMKTYHRKQSLEDGIIDYSDEELLGFQEEEGADDETLGPDAADKKVKILSDISLPKLDSSSEADALHTIASGIATSIGIGDEESGAGVGSEPKFVNADGNEMILTDEQRKEILSQLNQEHDGTGGVVMVLNDSAYTGASAAPTAPEATAPSEDSQADAPMEDEVDDSHIYKEFGGEASDKPKKASADESKESLEHLEWAENLISAQELAEDEEADPVRAISESAPKPLTVKPDDDISKKLKELTGDWSEDENDADSAAGEEEGTADESVGAADTTADVLLALNTEKLHDSKVSVKEEKEPVTDVSAENNSKAETVDEVTTTSKMEEVDVKAEAAEAVSTVADATTAAEVKSEAPEKEAREVDPLAMESVASAADVETEEESQAETATTASGEAVAADEEGEAKSQVNITPPPVEKDAPSSVAAIEEEETRKALLEELIAQANAEEQIEDDEEPTAADISLEGEEFLEISGKSEAEADNALDSNAPVEEAAKGVNEDVPVAVEVPAEAPLVKDEEDVSSSTAVATPTLPAAATIAAAESTVKSLITEWGADEDEEADNLDSLETAENIA